MLRVIKKYVIRDEVICKFLDFILTILVTYYKILEIGTAAKAISIIVLKMKYFDFAMPCCVLGK